MGKETIELKVHCGTPMISTLMFSGSEFYCVKCGWDEGVFGPAETIFWTPELNEEGKRNQTVFREIADVCIPAGCRFPNCKKCNDGQDHLLHASNGALRKSDEAYKLLAGGILGEITDATN